MLIFHLKSPQSVNISFVGAGNVAWHLAQALEAAGHKILEVYSRRPLAAEALCERLYEANVKRDLDFSHTQAEILLLAVADDALEEVIDRLILPDYLIVAHTSGAKSIALFEQYPYNYGVFYPLQTFSKGKAVAIEQVPFCIEAPDEIVRERLIVLARTLSRHVQLISSAQRRVLHVAAVFACNFANHLFTLSKDILDGESLSFDLLKPLIRETIEKALSIEPKLAQTGPAVRKDTQVITQHLDYLRHDPDKQRIYQILTESILNFDT